jgi:ATP-dependent Clp protease ATP-binding subunit ClpA
MEDYIIQIIVVSIIVILMIFGFKRQKNGVQKGKMKKTSLPEFMKDLTASAENGDIDPIFGREDEIERAIHIIMRRSKNNPLLIGEPGVGKTAIVEGLALQIVNKTVPKALQDKILLELDLNELLSGTKFRGELEGRLKSIIAKSTNESRRYILFIDEFHLLEEAGKAEGSLAISEVLKPLLARGDLQVIGATTWSEYQKFIKPNAALDRRMQLVLVDEPNPEQALLMLKGLKSMYEEFHKVKISDAALKAAVKLADEKIEERFLPDSAIDLIDEAAAKVAIEASVSQKVAMGVVHAAAKGERNKVTVKDIEEVVDQWVIHDKSEEQRDARHED